MTIHDNISEINMEQWAQLVENSPVASFFQTSECYELYVSLSFLKPFVFAVSENKKLVGLICGYMVADGGKIKQFFSRRAIIQGGVLLDENISEKALEKLLNFTVETLNNEVIYIEIRNCNGYSSFKEIIEKTGFNYLPHLNFHVKTQNLERAQKQLSSTKRRDIKISQQSGAEIVELKTKDAIAEFYTILQHLYQNKIRIPLFPVEFFEQFISFAGNKIFGIKYKEKIVGGSVCTCWKDVTYEIFVCGKDGEFENVFPSTLATWKSIIYALENNCAYLDMMGAGKPDKDYGVREFKAKFGGELVEFGRFLYVCNTFLYRIGKFYIEKIKFL